MDSFIVCWLVLAFSLFPAPSQLVHPSSSFVFSNYILVFITKNDEETIIINDYWSGPVVPMKFNIPTGNDWPPACACPAYFRLLAAVCAMLRWWYPFSCLPTINGWNGMDQLAAGWWMLWVFSFSLPFPSKWYQHCGNAAKKETSKTAGPFEWNAHPSTYPSFLTLVDKKHFWRPVNIWKPN